MKSRIQLSKPVTLLQAAFTRGVSALLIALVMGSGLIATAAAATETYEVDDVHSAVAFKIRHLVAKTSGHFDQFSGTLKFDADKPENSTIELSIQTSSIDTGNEDRDAHLRNPDFFDVEKFPTITFKSTKIEPAGEENLFKVTGDFTLHGVTKSVVVDVELLAFGETPMFGRRGGFSAETTINRKDFGIVWNKALDKGGAILGEKVEIDVTLEVAQPKEG